MGDLSSRKLLRSQLNCKSFQWYLDNIYPEKFKMEWDSIYYGSVKNVESDQCLCDPNFISEKNYTLIVRECWDEFKTSQEHFFSNEGHLRKESFCARSGENKTVHMDYCKKVDVVNSSSFKWQYDEKSKLISYEDANECLSLKNVSSESNEPEEMEYFVTLEECDSYASNQKWEFIPMKISVQYA